MTNKEILFYQVFYQFGPRQQEFILQTSKYYNVASVIVFDPEQMEKDKQKAVVKTINYHHNPINQMIQSQNAAQQIMNAGAAGNAMLQNASSSGVTTNQFSQRQSSRCNNTLQNQLEHVALGQKSLSNVNAPPVANLSGGGTTSVKRDNGINFKAMMNGVSPKNHQQNTASFNQQLDKVFQSFQQNQQSSTSNPVGEPAAPQSIGSTQNTVGSSIVGQAASSMIMSKKVTNGILPMVNSQQLMPSQSNGQKVGAAGFMGNKGGHQDSSVTQGSLTFGENEYKQYQANHQQFQKQLAQQNSSNPAPSSNMGPPHAHSVKLEKQMKLEMKAASMHFQANQVNGFSVGSRESGSHSGQASHGGRRQLTDEKVLASNQAQAQNNNANYQSNNQRQMQRRKLLFEYGLEKKIQSQATAPQSSSGFPSTSEQNGLSYSSKTAAKTGPVQKSTTNQSSIQQPRYGAAQLANFGAVKGSSLGHYQQQNGTGNQNNNNQQQNNNQMNNQNSIQRTPEAVSNASVNSAAMNNQTVPNSASQQSQSLKSAAQASASFKLSEHQQKAGKMPAANSTATGALIGHQQSSLHQSTELSRSVNRNMHNDMQRSGPGTQIAHIPGGAPGSSSVVAPSTHHSNSQTRKPYPNSLTQHKHQNSAGSMGLLEQLLMNLKAINIDKLETKEQEQLRFLSAQYQFHLSQFQTYQKQQILSGTFESAPGGGGANSASNNAGGNHKFYDFGANSNTVGSRHNNNQSGFSGRLAQQQQLGAANATKSGLSDFQNKSGLQRTEQKQTEGDHSLAQSSGHVKQQSASASNNGGGGFNNVYSSQERFVQNEKNLRELRLKKSKQRHENTPGESVGTTEANKAFGTNGTAGVGSEKSSGSPLLGPVGAGGDQDTKAQMLAQASSQKNLDRNASQSKINHASGGTAPNPQNLNDQHKFANELSTTGSSNKNSQHVNSKTPTLPGGLAAAHPNKDGTGLMAAPPKTNTIGDLPFSFHLNLPHPVPQISSSDIKGLNANQRVAIFKHLQKREKSKFLGIQQNKMKTQEKQVQIKFTQQRFRSRQLGGGAVGGGVGGPFDKGSRDRAYLGAESRAAGISVGGSGTGARTGMSRFVSVGQRGQRDANGRFNQMESDLAAQAQFDKQMENLRRQWASDLRAFGIFQQNELWQFSQMNDSQQKQILVCNLQQGKFQGLIDEQYEMLMQRQAQQAWTNQRNALLARDKELGIEPGSQPTNRGDGLAEQQDLQSQSKQQRRHTYGSALSSINKDEEKGADGTHQSKQQTFRNSTNFDQGSTAADPANGAAGATTASAHPYAQGLSFTEGDRERADLYPGGGAEGRRSPSPAKHSAVTSKNLMNTPTKLQLATSQKTTGGAEGANLMDMDYGLGAEPADKDKTININFKDLEKRQAQATDTPKVAGPPAGDYQAAPQGLGFGPNKVERDINDARTFLQPVQRRYEDSKDSFQECLRQILCRYQHQINLSLVQGNGGAADGQANSKLGLESLLPNFTRNLLHRQYNKDAMLNEMNGGLKHRQSESAKNNGQGAGGANGKGTLNTITNEAGKYGTKAGGRLKAGPEGAGAAGKLYHKLKVNGKDDGGANGKKKDSATIVAPDSTKSGAKKVGKDGKEVEGAEDEEGKEAVTEEVKKPRYFPPRRLPNPFESAAQEQERFIQARKDALLKYSNISKNRYKQDESQPLKYVIRPGNNSKLLTRVMEESGRVEPRYDKNDPDTMIFPGWEPADDHYDSLYHFKWKPTSGGIKHDLISKHGLKQIVNHVRGHGTLTTKDNLFLNLKQFYESQKLNIFEVVPLTIVIDYLKDDVSQRVEQVQAVLNLIDKHIQQDYETINQKLHEMQLQKEKSVKTPYKISACCHNQQNLWLLKPTGFNRGIGIHIFQNFDQLRDIMCVNYGIGRGARDKASIFQQHNHNHNPNTNVQGGTTDPNGEKQERMKNFTFVVQKLVERPMLYFKRKFDIRQWVLLNASDGRVYIYRESYVRTSSKEYVPYDPEVPEEEQIYMQLTNNAVQKVGEDYGKYEEGNIVSVHTLFEYIAQQSAAGGQAKQALEDRYLKDVDKIIIDSMKAVKGQVAFQKHTYELLGYDFILDEDLNTILIEVNTNPCLEESNDLLRRLLPRMLDDMLNVVLDPIFGPGVNPAAYGGYSEAPHPNRAPEKYKSKFVLRPEVFSVQANKAGGDPDAASFHESGPHAGYRDDENLWRHICNLE